MSQFFVKTEDTAGGAVLTVQGNTGGPIPPDINGEINIIGSGGISVSGNAGTSTLTISDTSSGENFAVTGLTNADSPYVVQGTDYFLACNTTGGTIVIHFPNAPSKGDAFVVKDSLGTSATNAITVSTVGGTVTFDGTTSKLINTNYASIQIIFDGTNYEIF